VVVLGVELGVLLLLGRHLTLEATHPGLFAFTYFLTRVSVYTRLACTMFLLLCLLDRWDDRHMPLCPAFG
jgi:hypothetical protein